MKDINRRASLLVLLAAVGINILNGVLYTWSSISQSIVTQWGWTSKQASLPYSVYSIFLVVAMVCFGSLQDRKGPRGIASLGSIFLGLGFIFSAFVSSPLVMVITIGVIVGTGVGMHTVTTAPTAVKWYPYNNKGLITGLVASGAAISSLIFSPLGKYLLTNIGINRTFLYIGLFELVFTLLLSQFLKNPIHILNNSDKSLDYTKNRDVKDLLNKDKDWRYMLKDKSFYKVWIMKAFSASAGLMIISHISSIAYIQANIEFGYILIIILSIFNSLGRVICGMVSDKIGRINLLRIVFILQSINMILFRYYTNMELLLIGVVISGFCYGAGISVFPATISDMYGMKNYGHNYGLTFTAWGAGGVIGPMVGASIFDATGKYNLAYLIALTILIIAISLTFTFKEQNLLEILSK